ncbi:MAG: hypothetical protein Q7S98_05645 [Deltaproteobacteria bacterium]|nr:hypothetical protein [Deltaproteobacteria bacterium]
MEEESKELGPSLGRLLIGVSGLMILGSLWTRSAETIGSLTIGVTVGLANYFLIRQIVRRLLGLSTAGKGRLIITFALKFLILFAIIGLILLKTDVRPLPLLVGLSNIVVAVLLIALKDIFHA